MNGVDELFFLRENQHGGRSLLKTFQQIHHLGLFFDVFHFLKRIRVGIENELTDEPTDELLSTR